MSPERDKEEKEKLDGDMSSAPTYSSPEHDREHGDEVSGAKHRAREAEDGNDQQPRD